MFLTKDVNYTLESTADEIIRWCLREEILESSKNRVNGGNTKHAKLRTTPALTHVESQTT